MDGCDAPDARDLARREWERTNRSWSLLHEDEKGQLRQFRPDDFRQNELVQRRLALRDKARGLIRSIVLALDLSERSLAPRDFGIPRIRLLVEYLRPFLTEFYEQNPISQVAIMATYGGQGHVLTPLCGALDLHLRCVDGLADLETSGEPSIQNCLSVASSVLKTAARYSTREIIAIYGSLNTCDIAPIDATIRSLVLSTVKVSIIGFGAAVFVLSRIANETGGLYRVPVDAEHFHNILSAHIEPPEWARTHERLEMVPFGFVSNAGDVPAFDLAELRANRAARPRSGGLACPRCGIRVFTIPVYCPACSLLLLTPAHITRCLVHLHELAEFEPAADIADVCTGCGMRIAGMEQFRCGDCGAYFCTDCDRLFHADLHLCPACLQNTAEREHD
jgi:transcription initiation factor TFIIH subunit 2